MNQKIMREAKLFSKLSHENIVRYYAAWIESTSTHRADTPEEIVSHKSESVNVAPQKGTIKYS